MAAKKSSTLVKAVSVVFTSLLAPVTVSVVSTALKNDAAGSSHDERSAAIVESAPQASAVRLLPPMNPGDPIPAPREVTVQWRPAKPAND